MSLKASSGLPPSLIAAGRGSVAVNGFHLAQSRLANNRMNPTALSGAKIGDHTRFRVLSSEGSPPQPGGGLCGTLGAAYSNTNHKLQPELGNNKMVGKAFWLMKAVEVTWRILNAATLLIAFLAPWFPVSLVGGILNGFQVVDLLVFSISYDA
ncbi:MAG: hypothetical protein ACFFH0_10495, partial [Promethearchaeota archaeon]